MENGSTLPPLDIKTNAALSSLSFTTDATIQVINNQIHVRARKFTHIGAKASDKIRPLKLSSEGDKDIVKGNLKQLKTGGLDIGNLSVRDDLTQKERELLKKYVDSAKQKSAEDPVNFWVVRGTPKNGLRIIQRTRKNQQ